MNQEHWKTQLSSGEFTLIMAVVCMIVLVCFGLAFYYLKRARLIEDTPTSRIRSAAQGYVELVGAVSTSETGRLTAPLSGIPCVWFDYKVQHYQKSGKSGYWHTINQGTSSHWFKINDKTDTCVIDPQGAIVDTEHSRTWYGNSEIPSQRREKSGGLFCSLLGRRYRYIEKFIYIHDVIYALGNFQSIGGGRHLPSNHKMTGEVIKEWKKNYDWILQNFDQDNNGEIDMQEWDQVRKTAGKEAEKRRSNISINPTTHILSKTPTKQHPFILSTHSQKTLSNRFRYYAITALVGGTIGCYFAVSLIV